MDNSKTYPKVVIFDLDGTLYDKKGLARRLVWSALRQGKLDYLRQERAIRRQLKGMHFDSKEDFYDAFFGKFSNPQKAREWYFNAYLPSMVSILKRSFQMYLWVPETIEAIRSQGSRVVIFSDYGAVNEKLEAIGFASAWADACYDAPALGGLKPCRESFLKICELLEVAPEACLMVGDRHDTDGIGATAAGMHFLLYVRNSWPRIDLYASHL